MRLWLTSTLFLLMNAGSALAQDCVGYDIYDAGRTYPGGTLLVSYVADIQEQDLFNSSGIRLQGVEQILRQDRANVHKFGLGSDIDTRDQFFNVPANRAILENTQLVTNCSADLSVLKSQISQARVPGFLEIMVFRMNGAKRYVAYINVVG